MLEVWNRNELIWVAAGALRYDQDHVGFLLPYLQEMREGYYPKEPGGGYEEGKSAGLMAVAPHEKACLIYCELDIRLAKTWPDRYLVEDHYCNRLDGEALASKNSLSRVEVFRRIQSTISYIASGKCYRWVSCDECGQNEGCRKLIRMREKGKIRTAYTYQQWVRSRGNRHEAKNMRLHTKT
jgi:hypothetical protein